MVVDLAAAAQAVCLLVLQALLLDHPLLSRLETVVLEQQAQVLKEQRVLIPFLEALLQVAVVEAGHFLIRCKTVYRAVLEEVRGLLLLHLILLALLVQEYLDKVMQVV